MQIERSSPGMILFLNRLTSLFLFAFSFLRISIHPSSNGMREIKQEALPPKSYVPIGQGGPLRPAHLAQNPSCQSNSDPPTPDTRESHATCQSTSCWNTSICIMYDIPSVPFRRVSLPTCLECHSDESPAACLACHCSESACPHS